MQKINIALISPSKNAYSETFIQAHKQLLKGTIFYYFGGELPTELEGGLLINSRKKRIIDIFKGHYRLNKFSLAEQALLTSFKNNSIDLVFAEYGGTGEKILPICKELNLPLIVHFHGFDASRKDQLENNKNYKEIFDYARFIVVVSKMMENDLLALGCPQEKILLNVYGPREEFLDVTPQFSKDQFLAVGRFVDKKAPYYLILCFLEVVKKFPEAKLLIAGDGELFNACSNLITFYKLEQNIKLVGIITAEQFRNYLKESLAFVQHSITTIDGDSEGFPVVILEASAAGLPVISTRHAGISEIVVDEKTGLLSDEHKVIEMANNMLRLLEDKRFALKLGEEGKKHIQKNFTLDRHIATLNNIIQSSLDSN